MRMRFLLAIGVAWAAAGCGARYASRSDRGESQSAANRPADLWAIQQPQSQLDQPGGQRDGIAARTPPPQLAQRAGEAGSPSRKPSIAEESASAVANRKETSGVQPEPPPPMPLQIQSAAPARKPRVEPPKITAVQPAPKSTLQGVAADVASDPPQKADAQPTLSANLRPALPAKSATTGGKIQAVEVSRSATSAATAQPAKLQVERSAPNAKIAAIQRKSVASTPLSVAAKPPTTAPDPKSAVIVRSAGSNGRASVKSPSHSVAVDIRRKDKSTPVTSAKPPMPSSAPPIVSTSAAKAKSVGTIHGSGVANKKTSESVLREFFSEKAAPAAKPKPFVASLGPSLGKSATPSKATDIAAEHGNKITVFYGTDRKATNLQMDWHNFGNVLKIGLAVGGAVATVFFGGAAFMLNGRGKLLALAMLLLSAAVGLPASQSVRGLERITTYGGERGPLVMGSCVVSLPKSHQTGELERPSLLKLEFTEDPKKHVVVLGIRETSFTDCMCDIKTCVADSADKEAFVFVHGYNVGFEEAAQRTAQIAHDLEFKGAPIFFSWPSQGGLFKYTIDETNVQWAVPDLTAFLKKIAAESGAKTIHLIAHSMGNRALVAALQRFAAESAGAEKPTKFNEVVLAAPDIDAETFKHQLAPAIIKAADRLTMYASSTDRALIASRKVHGYPRAGDSGRDLVVVEGIDTIDVSAVDMSLLGHDYYGSSPVILKDLLELIRLRKKAAERTYLRPAGTETGPYWIFDPLAQATRSLATPR